MITRSKAVRQGAIVLACGVVAFACRKPERPQAAVIADDKLSASKQDSLDRRVLDAAKEPDEGQSTRTARLPFLLILHGLGGTGAQVEQDLKLAAFANEKHFTYLAPDGTLDAQGRRFWDAGPVCCNFGNVAVNHVESLVAEIQSAIETRNADPSRVYVVGYSNGGYMAHRLACERPSLIRGIVSIAAAGPAPSMHCNSEQPVAVLEIHGDQDHVVPFDGGFLFGRPEFPRSPPVRDGLGRWAKVNGCAGYLRQSRHVDLVDLIPGAEAEVSEFSRCAKAPIQLWRIAGGSHILPLNELARDEIWRFLTLMDQAN